jgi:hypothetical protein
MWPAPILQTYKEYRVSVRETCLDYTRFDQHKYTQALAEFSTVLDSTANIAYIYNPNKTQTENIEQEVLFNTERAKYTRAAQEAKELIKTVTCEYTQDHDKI